LTDKKLCENSNNYINTDESLERFHIKLKERNKKLKKELIIVDSLSNDNGSFNGTINNNKERNKNETGLINKTAYRKQKSIAKNIQKALEYYNIIQS
jgi:hypothetical protein